LRSYKEAFAKCDLIASPVSPFAAFEIGAIKDPLQMYLEDIYTIGINLAGLPAVSIPNGFSQDGKPMGLQLIGSQKHDRLVLNTAHILEQSLSFNNAIPELVKEEILR
jgi:aspartyl-tRNA(Asn)/glutamyl-tRNA(Gln) amidotransferase subunit A